MLWTSSLQKPTTPTADNHLAWGPVGACVWEQLKSYVDEAEALGCFATTLLVY